MRSGAGTTGVSAPSARHAVIDSRMTRTFNLQTPAQPNDCLMFKSIRIRGCRQLALAPVQGAGGAGKFTRGQISNAFARMKEGVVGDRGLAGGAARPTEK